MRERIHMFKKISNPHPFPKAPCRATAPRDKLYFEIFNLRNKFKFGKQFFCRAESFIFILLNLNFTFCTISIFQSFSTKGGWVKMDR